MNTTISNLYFCLAIIRRSLNKKNIRSCFPYCYNFEKKKKRKNNDINLNSLEFYVLEYI